MRHINSSWTISYFLSLLVWRNDLIIPQTKKDFNKNKFFNKCLKEYNDIMALKTGRKLRSTGENESVFNEKDSIITFKKKLKKYLQSSIKN